MIFTKSELDLAQSKTDKFHYMSNAEKRAYINDHKEEILQRASDEEPRTDIAKDFPLSVTSLNKRIQLWKKEDESNR